MSHVLTEAAASADFTTGLTVPDHGDDFDDSCDVVVADVQQIADRLQWLKGWTATTPRVSVPLIGLINSSSRFGVLHSTAIVWQQSSVASAGLLVFQVPTLPIGRKITAVTATIKNAFTTNISIGTKPRMELVKLKVTPTDSGSSISSVSDTTAVLGTYQAAHDFSITGLTETISADYEYAVTFEGETGANSTTGLTLFRIFLTLGY